MTLPIAHIYNGELGFDVRTKLNDLIDLAGGGAAPFTPGIIPFADASGFLAQDATFFWDNALNDLHIGGAYYVNAARALYVVPNVSGNNWFEGNSGNQTLSGYDNFATGDLALGQMTSGYRNVAVGSSAAKFMTSGFQNFALGSFAMWFNQADSNNVAVGFQALATLGNGGAGGGGNVNNIAVGYSTMSQLTLGYNNVAIGTQSLNNLYAALSYNNTAIGTAAANSLGVAGSSISANTFIGAGCGLNITGGLNNVWLGGYNGVAGVVNNTVVLSTGAGNLHMLDAGMTDQWGWSFSMAANTVPTAVYIYNMQYPVYTTTNYERAKIGWDSAGSNIFTIGVEAGGTGTVRPIKWVGLSNKTTPIGADHLLLLDSATSDTMKTVLISALPGGGGGMSIGGAITGGTASRVLFTGAGGVLDDDSTFTWNDTLKDLAIGGAYYVNAARALYAVPNVSGNNWFEGSAGNQTTTGYSNFGTGDGALGVLTNGYFNTALGTHALYSVTSGNSNTAVGQGALGFTVLDSGNFALGDSALINLGAGGAGGGSNVNNVAIGNSAMVNLTTGYYNVGIGYRALPNIVNTSFDNTVIGHSAGDKLGFGGGAAYKNTFIGANCGVNITGSCTENVWIGSWPGMSTSVNNTTVISDGHYFVFDCHYSTALTYSMMAFGFATGLHIYNTSDGAPPTNYERALLDWNKTSNTFVIGTEAGGTGVIRPIKWAGLSNKTTPIGADHLLLLDSTTSDTMKTVLISALPGGGGGMAIGGAITSATAGSVLFAGVAGVLTQDNANFFFDDATNVLKVGGHYNIGSSIAIFTIPNASGNNWFEGAAGNLSVTGYGNFGTGDQCLGLVTSGFYNTGIGAFVMGNVSSGSNNIGIGTDALKFTQTDTANIAVGAAALANLGIGGVGGGSNGGNIALGANAMINMTTGNSNISIGYNSLPSITGTGSNNTVIGASAASNLGSGAATVSYNTMIGAICGQNLNASSNGNTWLGSWAGISAAVTDTIVLANRYYLCDFNYSKADTFTVALPFYRPVGLHVYNVYDATPPVNYERGIFDWNVASNVLTIGTQRGGTGVLRPVNIIGSALTFNGSPIGGGGGMSIGGAITGGTASRVLFTGAGGVLDDDSTFLWNDSLKDLAIGGAYYVNAARALYVVPNVTENNWFEGNAGNATVTGYGNFGTGDLSLASLTSGYDNTAVGTKSLWKATDAYQNIAMGTSALENTVSDSYNIAIGYGALNRLGIAGAGGGGNTSNIAIGYNALAQAESSTWNNVVLGWNGMANCYTPSTATANVIVGAGAGQNLGSGAAGLLRENVLIGANAGRNLTGISLRNVWIGGYQGPVAALDSTICFSTGNGAWTLMDYNITKSGTWSIQTDPNIGYATALHLYGSQTAIGSITNYERAILDWQATSNTFTIDTQAGGSGVKRLLAIGGFAKAGAPAASDLPASTFAMIDDTSAGQTWLVFNKAGTIRKVQLT